MPGPSDSISLSLHLPQEPKRVFAAWMDPREHAQFTGGGAATIEPWTGGRFTAFEGEVHGIFLGVDAGVRIVQTFRTPDFPREMRDSRVTVSFEPHAGGTMLRITHSDVPPSLLKKLQRAWESNYLKSLPKHLLKSAKQRKAEATAEAEQKAAAAAAPPPAPAAKKKATPAPAKKAAPSAPAAKKPAPAAKKAAPAKKAAKKPAPKPKAKAKKPAKKPAPKKKKR
jgi:uncharacterized protein YndB with AHSA1/START domain